MGESRQELLAWLNDVRSSLQMQLTCQLLQLNLTKVEQCGQGAAICQIFDSIYCTIPIV